MDINSKKFKTNFMKLLKQKLGKTILSYNRCEAINGSESEQEPEHDNIKTK